MSTAQFVFSQYVLRIGVSEITTDETFQILIARVFAFNPIGRLIANRCR